jgi:hypothetical protein
MDDGVYLIGVDLGQAADYTAVAIAERTRVPTSEVSRMGRPKKEAHYAVRHLHRFRLGTAYPAIVDQLAELAAHPALEPEPILIVDTTGVGAPVFDLLHQRAQASPVFGITITGGDQSTRDGTHYRVPKRDLVSTLNVLLQTKRIRFAGAMPEARILRQELQQFRVRITATAHDTYGVWREGAHDDLVLAVAMACWYGENGYVGQLIR